MLTSLLSLSIILKDFNVYFKNYKFLKINFQNFIKFLGDAIIYFYIIIQIARLIEAVEIVRF